MRLADLHPILTGTLDKGRIEMDCPKHGRPCRIAFRVGPAQQVPPVWPCIGTFPDTLSIPVSLDFSKRTRDGSPTGDPCWHGGISNGEVT